MSAEQPPPLTGRWTGVYFYPVDPELNPDDTMPATPFMAELTDVNGIITGVTQEPDMFSGADAPPISATLDGQYFSGELVFTKTPHGGGQTHTIDYIGAVSADGNAIAGRWIIYDVWSGVFRMQRTVVVTTQKQTQEQTA